MKLKQVLLFVLLIAVLPAYSQDLPKKKSIPDQYEPFIPDKYNRLKRKAERRADKAAKDWDIVIDPIESVPIAEYDFFPAAAINNWGEDLLLPDDVKAELKSRATGKVVIKIGDTGQPEHDDLTRGVLEPTNYSTDESVKDGHGHATHIGGITSANRFGMLDALFEKGLAKIKYCKVLSDNGRGSFQWVATMIEAEDQDNAKWIEDGYGVITNFSLGGGTAPIGFVEEKLKASTSIGVIYVAAAGNSSGPVEYPGLSRYTLGISSLDPNLTISSFSCRGNEVDNAAPGRNITSTWKGGGYATLSGTSMASPFVTSLAAIAMAVYPELENINDVRAYFQQISADLGEPGEDDLYGWGLTYVRAILDNAPDGDPGDPEDPKRETRTLTFPVKGTYNMRWMIFGGANRFDSDNWQEQAIFYEDATAQAVWNNITITHLEVETKTEFTAWDEYDTLMTGVQDYFSKSGLGLPAGSDFHDAAGWVAYFLDRRLDVDHGVNANITRIVGQDDKKRQVILYDTDLRDWVVE